MTRVHVSVGSNVDREKNVRQAVGELRARFGEVRLSRVYESEAVGFDGAPFYNLVAAFDTELSVASLSRVLAEIEDASGRRRGGPRFAARTLDLDLLLFGDLVAADDGLVLPRKDILDHGFVLGPLAEIDPQVRHPVLEETYAALWGRFEGRGRDLRPTGLSL